MNKNKYDNLFIKKKFYDEWSFSKKKFNIYFSSVSKLF